jgi:GTP pyrophosphokinase
MVSRISEQLRETLAKAKVRAQVNGREKQPYSIWVKTQRKNIAFEQLSDIVAFRVIVDQVEDCYRAIGVIHLAYSVVPGRFKDYISTPKPNGYKSIHTAVIGPEKQRIEIQVRTREMHEVADLGVAAHWRYKIETEKVDGRQYRWMRELLDILDQAAGPEDFLEHTKLEMFANQVFCFTPKGDAITLPEGATPVDFAYAVHSEIGDTCVGCKINGKIMPLRAQLHNGDQVEIITSKAQTPLPMWENFVATGKARARIRRFIRQRERAEYINLGVAILERAFADAGYGLTDKALEQAVPKFRDATVDDLKAEVGAGHLTGIDVVEAVYPEIKKNRESRSFFGLGRRGTKSKAKDRAKNKGKNGKGHKDSVPIKGLIPGMAVHFAICCHPLPGDRIVGIVTKGRGVTIHTIDCESLEDFAEMPERWLDVSWDADAADSELRVGRLVVTVTNEPGSLGDCSTVIAKNGGNISNLKIVNRAVQFFDLAIDIEVQDLKHLTNIVGALRATPAIIAVERARG